MILNINNPVGETWIFGIILGIALILSIRRKKPRDFFKLSMTQELKGLAILAVIFSHIGYFLVSDHRFLFPLSILSGVAVDLFLFLSGYGLTFSHLKNKYDIKEFYRKRLSKLFVPFWIILVIFFALDFLILKTSYSWQYILQSFLGFFNSSNLYQDLNSPLWYFTLVLFYYLIFPLVFHRKHYWLSALGIYLITVLIVFWNPHFLSGVMDLYRLHIIAFPLGIIFAWLFINYHHFAHLFSQKFSLFLGYKKTLRLSGTIKKIIESRIFKQTIRYLFMTMLAIVIVYTSYHSGVGNIDQAKIISIVTMLAFLFFFLSMRFEFKLLDLLGFYSYEIYLLHWPILYHYDIFYRFLPAGIATALYLVLFLILAWALHKLTDRILKRKPKKVS